MRTSCLPALAIVAGGVALGGCSGKTTAPPSGTGSGSATAAAASAAGPAAAAPAGVAIFVNDTAVATIPTAQLASWPRLDTLVPADARRLGMWEAISLTGAQAQPTDVAKPATAYPDMVPAIFPGPGGAAFGMFDPVELAKKGQPALRQDNVTAIRIKVADGGGRGQNDDGGGGGGDPTTLVVTVMSPAGTTRLTGEQLLALPREPMPGNPDQRGWRLTALLDAAGVKRYERLVLADAAGMNLTLDRKDIDDSSIPFIKLNKQGMLRFRVFKKAGDGWTPSGDLRGLVSIQAK